METEAEWGSWGVAHFSASSLHISDQPTVFCDQLLYLQVCLGILRNSILWAAAFFPAIADLWLPENPPHTPAGNTVTLVAKSMQALFVLGENPGANTH